MTEKITQDNQQEKETDSNQSSSPDFFLTKDVSVCREIPLKNRFKVLLLRKGWSQSHLADIIGITRQTLNRIVNGDWIPTSQIKLRIAEALDCDSLVIFGATPYWQDYSEKIGYPRDREK